MKKTLIWLALTLIGLSQTHAQKTDTVLIESILIDDSIYNKIYDLVQSDPDNNFEFTDGNGNSFGISIAPSKNIINGIVLFGQSFTAEIFAINRKNVYIFPNEESDIDFAESVISDGLRQIIE